MKARSASGGLAESAALFKALSDPQRLAIVLALARAPGPMCVRDFAGMVPLNQPTVSHHLKLLRDAGFVVVQRRGTWAYYQLTDGVRRRMHEALDAVLVPSA